MYMDKEPYLHLTIIENGFSSWFEFRCMYHNIVHISFSYKEIYILSDS